jgi:hypothetical protein
VTSSSTEDGDSYGGRRKLPYVFTEQGVAMLSGVLKSDRAIEVNIQIMRAFVKMREYARQGLGLQKILRYLDKNTDVVMRILDEFVVTHRPPPVVGFIQ